MYLIRFGRIGSKHHDLPMRTNGCPVSLGDAEFVDVCGQPRVELLDEEVVFVCSVHLAVQISPPGYNAMLTVATSDIPSAGALVHVTRGKVAQPS